MTADKTPPECHPLAGYLSASLGLKMGFAIGWMEWGDANMQSMKIQHGKGYLLFGM